MDQSKCDHTCIAKANGDDANAAADDDDADDEVNDEEDDAKKGRRWMLISSSNKDGHCNAKLLFTTFLVGRPPPLQNYIEHTMYHYFVDDVYVNGCEVKWNMMMK